MVISELKAIIAPTSHVTIWSMNSKGIIECAHMGACKRLPEVFDNIEVRLIEACDNDIELTVKTEDLELENMRKEQVNAELEDMLGWMNIRR